MKYIEQDWLRLDTAGKLYPSIEGKKHPSLFHISATIAEPVDPELLQQAVIHITPRFPYYNVQLKKGFFWYYFDQMAEAPVLQKEKPYPCTRLNRKEDKRHLFRITYKDNRIGVEFFHALTDGTGAVTYLKTLLLTYARLRGYVIPKSTYIREPEAVSDGSEAEDAFNAHYIKQKTKNSFRKHKAFHVSGPLEPADTLHIITGRTLISDIKAKTRSYGVTITEYLAAVYLYTLYVIQKRHSLRRQPIRISVPVNLRNLYKTDTLRNFSLFVRPEINPVLGTYEFDEIVRHVHHSMQFDLQKKSLSSVISSNVYLERHPILKFLPRPIKSGIISFVYHNFGENLHSGTLSNLGLVILPKEMESFVTGFDFLLGHNRINTSNCAVIGYKENLHITFSRITSDPVIARNFFRILVKEDIPVEILRDL